MQSAEYDQEPCFSAVLQYSYSSTSMVLAVIMTLALTLLLRMHALRQTTD